jgi:FeS assembly SUF system protein
MAADGLRALRRVIAEPSADLGSDPGSDPAPDVASEGGPELAPASTPASPSEAGSEASASPSEASASPEALEGPGDTPSLSDALRAQGPPDPRLVDAVIEMLHTVYDPEIPVDVYELGLIYGVEVDAFGHVQISMTLTSPNCPSAQALPDEVREKVASIDGVAGAEVEIVWEPPWSPDRMSEEARLELNM